jgi:hypothetical protein
MPRKIPVPVQQTHPHDLNARFKALAAAHAKAKEKGVSK